MNKDFEMPSRLPAATSRTERFEVGGGARVVGIAAPRHARKRAYQPSSALL